MLRRKRGVQAVNSKRFLRTRTMAVSSSSKHRDDRGNTMIIAMAVLMIMGILAAAIWAKTISGLRFAGYDKTHLATLSVADSGIDEATFRLEQLDPEKQSTLEIMELNGEGSMSGGDYEYVATRQSELAWEMTAVAEIDGVRRAIRANAVTRPKFGFGVETVSALDLQGNPTDICSYDSREGAGSNPPYGELCSGGTPPLDAPIMATGGSLDCNGSGWDEVPVMIYPSGSSDCSMTSQSPSRHEWEPPVAPLPGGLTTLQDNAAGDCFVTEDDLDDLDAGAYNCKNLVLGPDGDEDLCTDPDLDMWNHVAIHVSGTVTFGSGVYINAADGTRGCNEPAMGPQMGSPAFWPTAQAGTFRLYVSSAAKIDIQTGTHLPAASMVLYAPYSWAVANGGPHLRLFGSAFLDTFTNNGALEVLGYDRSLSQITTKTYKIVNWREIPAPADVLPSPSPSVSVAPLP